MQKILLRLSILCIVTQAMQGQVTDSPLAQGEWWQVDVRETGMYKLDRRFFTDAGISTSSFASIRSIRLYGDGGRELPEDLNSPRPNGPEEIARHVVDMNGNGVFDSDDYIIFYGRSVRHWLYNPSSKTFNHYINHYSEVNYYFITFGGQNGRQMDSVASFPTGTLTPQADFQEKIFVEQERFNLLSSGRQWVGQSFDLLENTGLYFNTLHGYVATQPALYKFAVLSRSSTVDTFRVLESDQPLGNPIIMGAIIVGAGDDVGDYAYRSPVTTIARLGSLSNDLSTVKLVYGTRNQAAKGWLNWFEIHYRRRFEAVNDFLMISSPDTNANIEYMVGNLSSRENVQIFDVTDHPSVKRITQLNIDPVMNMVKFQLSHAAGGIKEFAVVGPSGFKTVTNPRKVPNSNLHGISPGAEFIIISPQEFLSEAERLKTHREKSDSVKTAVVIVDHIYNEFSGGLPDPMAVRDFLKFARTNWMLKPRYVLFLGAGHFDYKNIGTSARNWVLPYETLESNFRINSYASDDHLVTLDPANSKVTIASGRLPARSLGEASVMVDKIIAYETGVPFDPWRNRITYVGDDGLTSTTDDGDLHTGQTEQLAQTYTPSSFEKKKIYLIEYPTISSATGRRKPEANKDIVSAINRGTLVLNYIGHGNPKLWAHEAVFTREGDIAQLTNKERLTFLVAATCNYLEYDNPLDQSSGELLLAMDQGGAIGVVSSSRLVYSHDNAVFNYTLYGYLFQRDTLGRPNRLGDAMWTTKQYLSSTNDLKYHLFADPTMRLNMPRMGVSVDSVNGSSTTQLVAMRSLGRVTVNGKINRPNGTTWTTFNGRGVFEVFDSRRRLTVSEWGGFTFEVSGSLLYRGEISVMNGTFQNTFPLPKDVSYGGSSRISLYAWNDSTDAVGFTENVTISGTDSTAAADTVGPRISIYLDDRAFRPGDVTRPDPMLIVDLFDDSGINTSVAGIGHRLEAFIGSRGVDLADYYRSNLDTYQSGEVRYPLTNLAEGKHHLTVRAWDTHNNSAEAEILFEVRPAAEFGIYNVVNYPNPFSGNTVFTFQKSSAEPLDVEVKIYTIAGRLIQTINSYSLTDRFAQILWDGRDYDGHELANGVYLYKVIARTPDRQKSVEVLGKMAVLR